MFQNSALPTTAELPQRLPHAGLVHTLRRMARDVPLPQSGREYLGWMLMMVFVASLMALQIWISMRIAQAEQRVVELSGTYVLIEQENAEILWQISQFTNLERIKIEATRMGYAPSLKREYRWVQPNQHLAVPAVNVDEHSVALGSAPAAHVEHGKSAPTGQLPWYVTYWQEIRSWWQPQEAAVGVMWQQ